MYGYVACHAAEEPPYRAVGGIRFRVVYVALGETPRARLSARAAARKLARESVRYALFPPEYPYCEAFARHGIIPPPLAPLYRASAAAIVMQYLAQRGVETRHAAVTFVAERVTSELRRAVEALCAEVRYIALAIPQGGDALARSLRCGLGVAARVEPLSELPRADLVVAFDNTISGDNVLRLNESLCVVYDSELPNELLALLWRAGALNTDTLRIKNVTRNSA